MHRYFIHIPSWVPFFFPRYWWKKPVSEKIVYLTFDDGPHPSITSWVLDQLKAYHAKATFFCIGNNVAKYPEIFERIQKEGHRIGNHTYHHLNGWKTDVNTYIDDIRQADEMIGSDLFRPPYGRIRSAQFRALKKWKSSMQVVMWNVLSADFDASFSHEECFHNVVEHVRPGSIVVFHDSEKAWSHLSFVLPRVLEWLRSEGYQCQVL